MARCKRTYSTVAAALAACWLAVPAFAQTPSTLAISNIRIVTVSGPVIESGTILIENGKIKAIGSHVAIPAGTKVLDFSGKGKVAMPGLVDANARFGLKDVSNEQYAEVTPNYRILNQFVPDSPDVRRALQSGVTSACLTPGSANIVGGLCGVVKTFGDSVGTMKVRDAVGMRAALGEDAFSGNGGFRSAGPNLSSIYLRRPNSRMAAVFELRHALDQLDKYPVLNAVVNGNMPLRVHARTANDIRAAITIADEFKVKNLVIDDCAEGYRDLDVLAAHRIPVVLGPAQDPQVFGPERTATSLNNAGLLTDKGIRVAFGTSGGDETQLRFTAIMAVRGGMRSDLALKAITQTAADLSGVGDRVGTLEPGKDADLLILDGDILETQTHIDKVLINGRVVYSGE